MNPVHINNPVTHEIVNPTPTGGIEDFDKVHDQAGLVAQQKLVDMLLEEQAQAEKDFISAKQGEGLPDPEDTLAQTLSTLEQESDEEHAEDHHVTYQDVLDYINTVEGANGLSPEQVQDRIAFYLFSMYGTDFIVAGNQVPAYQILEAAKMFAHIQTGMLPTDGNGVYETQYVNLNGQKVSIYNNPDVPEVNSLSDIRINTDEGGDPTSNGPTVSSKFNFEVVGQYHEGSYFAHKVSQDVISMYIAYQTSLIVNNRDHNVLQTASPEQLQSLFNYLIDYSVSNHVTSFRWYTGHGTFAEYNNLDVNMALNEVSQYRNLFIRNILENAARYNLLPSQALRDSLSESGSYQERFAAYVATNMPTATPTSTPFPTPTATVEHTPASTPEATITPVPTVFKPLIRPTSLPFGREFPLSDLTDEGVKRVNELRALGLLTALFAAGSVYEVYAFVKRQRTERKYAQILTDTFGDSSGDWMKLTGKGNKDRYYVDTRFDADIRRLAIEVEELANRDLRRELKRFLKQSFNGSATVTIPKSVRKILQERGHTFY